MGGIVVVTGGSGFIGSHLVEALRNKGKKVINIDKRPPVSFRTGVVYQNADLSKDDFIFPDEPPEVLYHLAATPWSMVKDSEGWFHGSKDAFYNNTVGTYNALRTINPKMIVFSSTANLYGEGRKFSEMSPVQLSSQYGYSKWVAEEIIRKSGKKHIVFRFGTVVGTRGRCFPNRLVWSAIREIPEEIFCNGQAYRDLVDVNDIVDALTKASTFNLPENTGLYNVSMGMEISTGELANLVADVAMQKGYKTNFTLTSFKAPGYVKESTLDISKIERQQNWHPKSDIYKIINTLFTYYESEDAIEPPPWNLV
jgi:UDP-glucose 4-epimerase